MYGPSKFPGVNDLDTLVNAIGIIYGVCLMLATFVHHKFTEAIRVDALFIPRCTESTRPLNLVVGLLIAGYSGYSLFAR